uniref:Ig-like domain-containing protein n=1 Tax=Sander lucioperca TaxID=283035 RepID=A0A8D0A392_SANLU
MHKNRSSSKGKEALTPSSSPRTPTPSNIICWWCVPKFGPPAVELFSEGEEVTLRCRDWRKGRGHGWFIKSNRTEGRIFSVESDQRMSRVSWYDNGSLVISNISVGDTGEYWCVVFDNDYQCESTERTVLVYMEPFGIYSTFFKVRCSVLSVLLLILVYTGFNTAWYTLALKQGMGHIHAEKTFKLEHKRQKQQTEIMGRKT